MVYYRGNQQSQKSAKRNNVCKVISYFFYVVCVYAIFAYHVKPGFILYIAYQKGQVNLKISKVIIACLAIFAFSDFYHDGEETYVVERPEIRQDSAF